MFCFRPAPTYETASLRLYYKGRTETVRSCTSEAVDFSRVFLDPKAMFADKVELLKKAIDKQTTNMLDAVDMKVREASLFMGSLLKIIFFTDKNVRNEDLSVKPVYVFLAFCGP